MINRRNLLTRLGADGIHWDFDRATLACSHRLRWNDGRIRRQAFLECPQRLMENLPERS